jgi:hypothetical protein
VDEALKRISLLLKESQYQALTERGLNVSGLIRDLVDDYLSEHRITLSVSEETRALYDKIVSNTGSNDAEVEKYLKDALKHLLKDKIREMQRLEEKL